MELDRRQAKGGNGEAVARGQTDTRTLPAPPGPQAEEGTVDSRGGEHHVTAVIVLHVFGCKNIKIPKDKYYAVCR